MNFDLIINRLQTILSLPLPGKIGQLTMSPLPIDESRFGNPIRTDHRKGAVMVLFYPDGENCFVPFIKRQPYDGVHSGQISFPGGKMDPEDKDLEQTALRETEEEIGILHKDIRILGKLSDLYIPPSNFLVSPYIGFMEEKPAFEPDPYEVNRIIECSFPYLLDKKIRKRGAVNLSTGQKVEAPYFEIDNELVWGATAMILGELTYLWENS
jgi:8-oxo-dGTP pyrophosphatase MutT (NUDIX family)